MDWSTTVRQIPHIYDTIFGALPMVDRLTVSAVCSQWNTAINHSRKLMQNLALRVLRTVNNKQEIIGIEEVENSQRLYNKLLIAPNAEERIDWEDLSTVLQRLNNRCPIRWVKIDGSRNILATSPLALMGFGQIFSNLQHLELNCRSMTYVLDSRTVDSFSNFPQLKRLVLFEGHGGMLKSVQRHCRHLRKLVLIKFVLTKPLRELLNFPELTELVIDMLDVYVDPRIVGEPQQGPRSALALPKLTEMTVLLNGSLREDVATNMLQMTLAAPSLKIGRMTEVISDHVRIEAGAKAKFYRSGREALLMANCQSEFTAE
ncbi:uncharacterized protein LOC129761505 [Toxorhynchites rutilus septentrionalis]|uniref:uncharacterized protein LOC129761505 n=1 Tax=Toxorhynchites rutilus septentrionalis TaxID=329112 RepID=UPI00247A0027|nr:uncharacterized protein LOC129761505 [Toxorhynchites rutilus septentrionalis]